MEREKDFEEISGKEEKTLSSLYADQ